MKWIALIVAALLSATITAAITRRARQIGPTPPETSADPIIPIRPTADQINEALLKAEQTIREGVANLAITYPDLQVTDRGSLSQSLQERRIGHEVSISITHYAAVTRPSPGTPEERHGFAVKVWLIPPPGRDFTNLQVVPMILYRSLNVSGAVFVWAGNPQLDAALNKLVKEALAPIEQLEKQAQDVDGNPLP